MANTLGNTAAATPTDAGSDEQRESRLRLTAAVPGFEQIVADEQERVTRLCYRLLGWRADVEDVVQDVFLSAFRALPTFRGESSVSTWLTRIAVNTCRTAMRKRTRWLRWMAGVREEMASEESPAADHGAVDDERFAEVRATVNRLPDKYREVVVLRYLEQMPTQEVGDVLGLTRNTVEVRLSRARAQLKEDLGSEFASM